MDIPPVDWTLPAPRAGHARDMCVRALGPISQALGAATKLEIRQGRILCQTESGIPLIVPRLRND